MRRTTFVSAAAALVTGAALLGAGPATAAEPLGPVHQAKQHVAGQYIVALEGDAPKAAAGKAAELLGSYGGALITVYSVTFNGFSVKDMTDLQARRLAADPAVRGVWEDGTARVAGEQPNPPSWGLDQIDQKTTSLDKKYVYPNTADSVTAYVIDTGVEKGHAEFEGRASSGYDYVDNDADAADCHGHGTHVSGTIAGKTVGVAKKAKIVAVRALGCNGSAPDSAAVSAMEWVAKNGATPGVVNMSMTMDNVGVGDEQAKALVAKGFVLAVAAGNNGVDACGVSPARVPEAITVGWINQGGGRSGNYGTCLDLFAPGGNIHSSTLNGGYGTMSGTSMASPHVAGVAAMYLHANAGATPQKVRDEIVDNATPNLVTSPGSGSPNKLLWSGFITGGGTPTCGTKANDEDVAVPDAGAAVGSAITQDRCDGRASGTLPVKVDVDHTFTRDLSIDLVGPSGAVFTLKAAGGVGESGGIHKTYSVNASGENANGTWKLQVKDAHRYDTGTLTGWSIDF
ncbi:S8 family serine peptidase [Spirillospora sp. CA-294931]|uniref:S8 family serine peptidase n=1 Tax=Spirillospora sp. CA-294931 TaxID=3240042 RepID=UPI003D9325ED